jgi:hypothetical protein
MLGKVIKYIAGKKIGPRSRRILPAIDAADLNLLLYRQKKIVGTLKYRVHITGKCAVQIDVIEEKQTVIGVGAGASSKILKEGLGAS